MRDAITCGIRLTLSGALLLVVWRHSHWSAALALTWLAVAAEINGTLLTTPWKREQQRKELRRIMRLAGLPLGGRDW